VSAFREGKKYKKDACTHALESKLQNKKKITKENISNQNYNHTCAKN